MIERLRKARQSTVVVGKYTFSVTRPTDMQMFEMRSRKIAQRDILEQYVTGWSGVTELDISAEGSNEPVIFSGDLFDEWIADRPELWAPIVTAIVDLYRAHEKAQETVAKN